MLVCFLVTAIKDRKFFKSRAFYTSWIVAFIFCIPHLPRLWEYSTTQIGDFYEANTYIETYYIYMSREPETVKNRKVYTLPAEIERREDLKGTTDDGHDIIILNYHINHLYFPNGDYLSFDYDGAYENIENTKIKLNKEKIISDYHGNDYYITLTSKKQNK